MVSWFSNAVQITCKRFLETFKRKRRIWNTIFWFTMNVFKAAQGTWPTVIFRNAVQVRRVAWPQACRCLLLWSVLSKDGISALVGIKGIKQQKRVQHVSLNESNGQYWESSVVEDGLTRIFSFFDLVLIMWLAVLWKFAEYLIALFECGERYTRNRKPSTL